MDERVGEMTLAEKLDIAVIRTLKAVRLEGEEELVAWRKHVIPICDECLDMVPIANQGIFQELLSLLQAIHKSIWDRDTHVRNCPPVFNNGNHMALIGVLAIDARDFNHLRVRVVDLLNVVLGEEGADPNVKDGRLGIK